MKNGSKTLFLRNNRLAKIGCGWRFKHPYLTSIGPAAIALRSESTSCNRSLIMRITINGEERNFAPPLTLSNLLLRLGLDQSKIAVELNLEIVPRSTFKRTEILDGDKLEIVHFIGGGQNQSFPASDNKTTNESADEDCWTIAGRRLNSRLIVGTGKYRNFEETALAIEAAGAEIVTVAVRRVNITDPDTPMLTDYVDPKKYIYLPNTAGCFTYASLFSGEYHRKVRRYLSQSGRSRW